MITSQAREIARRWVAEEFSGTPGFYGAFLHGSINSLAGNDALPDGSDLDLIVVIENPDSAPKPGKRPVQGAVLDVSYLPTSQVQSPESILGQSHLATSFRSPSVVADPSGRLTGIQAAVSQSFAEREWVVRRVEHTLDKIRHQFTLDLSDPFHEQVISWIFPAGITTHVLLVAGLKNPTVRKRYLAVRELLAEYGHSSFYEELLELVGCRQMSRSRAQRRLDALTEAFDASSACIRTPFPFASDISELGRPISIGGTQELISSGNHREAVFWLVVTYSRCQAVLYRDAPPELRLTYDGGYRALLGDLGITSPDDLQRRKREVIRFLPRTWEVAQEIIAANQQIQG